MNLNKLLYLDTETTGIDKESRIVQIAYLISGTREMVNKIVKPPVEVTTRSTAVHHITQDEADKHKPFKGSELEKHLIELLKDHILVAHNAPFDIRMLEKEGLHVPRYIDTLVLARKLLDLDSYKLQYLRYELGLDVEDAVAHSAEGDVIILENLFRYLYGLMAEGFENPILQEMMKERDKPKMLRVFGYGKKHKGEKISDIVETDRQYLVWFLNEELKKKNQNKDLVYTLKKVLGE